MNNYLDISLVSEALEKQFSKEINEQMFGDYKPKPDKRSPFQKFLDNTKYTIIEKINYIRVGLAEWIGGERLHENCDY